MKSVVIALGRFQPPSAGHAAVMQAVVKEARKNNADMEVFVIAGEKSSLDKRVNPLSVDDRIKYLRIFFPGIIFIPAPTAHEALWKVGMAGYDHLILVAGKDRAEGYKSMIADGMASQDEEKRFRFEKFDVVPLSRDPDSEGIEGASGTKMRQAAVSGNWEMFRGMAPKGAESAVASMYNTVRKAILDYTNERQKEKERKKEERRKERERKKQERQKIKNG